MRKRNKNHAHRRRARLLTGFYRAQLGGQGSRETTTTDIITDLLLGLPERAWMRALCIGLRDAIEDRFGEGAGKDLALYAAGLDVPEEDMPTVHDAMEYVPEVFEQDAPASGPRPFTFLIDFREPFSVFAQEVVVASGEDEQEAQKAASRALGIAFEREGLSADPLGDDQAYVTATLNGDVADLVTSVASGDCEPIRA